MYDLPVDDPALFALIRSELYSAVIGDILDTLGYLNQFLPPQIKPLSEKMVLVGRAMTVEEKDTADICQAEETGLNKPFGLMLDALDDLKSNEVYFCSGTPSDYALWGEIMSARAQKTGAAGAVINGWIRDTKGIRDLGFCVFSYGSYAKDQAPRGKVVAYRKPIMIHTVRINPGDIVFGDRDGVIIIPRNMEKDVIGMALQKARGEKTVLKEIKNGLTAKEAFQRYGIM